MRSAPGFQLVTVPTIHCVSLPVLTMPTRLPAAKLVEVPLITLKVREPVPIDTGVFRFLELVTLT